MTTSPVMRSVVRVGLQLLGIKAGERRRVLAISLAYGFVLGSLYMLKPARNALFLSKMGADQLPFVLLVVAVIGALTAVAFARLTAAVKLERAVLWTFPLLVVSLLGFWQLLTQEDSFGVFAFYVWVNLCGHISTSLIWLLANGAFDAREARRAFGVIGAVGIAGAVLGGLLTQMLVPVLGTHHLLLVCAGFMGVAGLVLTRVRVPTEAERRKRQFPVAASLVGDMKEHRLLRILALVLFVAAAVSAVIDVQFIRIVDASFVTEDEKTEYFGAFFAVLNGGAFLLQVLLTPRILGRFGLAPALLCLPACIALGSAGVFLLPSLVMGTALKAADGGLRHSINKSALEILFVPLPAAVKKRTKVLLDATLDNLGTGLGALGVLFVTSTLALGTSALSVVSGVGVLFWLVLAWRARGAYLDAFRVALERRELDFDDIRVRMQEASHVALFIPVLRGSNRRQLRYALDMLQSVQDPALPEPLLALLASSDPDILAMTLRALARQKVTQGTEAVSPLIQHADASVRVEAMHAYVELGTGAPRSVLAQMLGRGGLHRVAALDAIGAYYGALAKGLLSEELIANVMAELGEDGPLTRAALARALGAGGHVDPLPLLLKLREDPHPAVVQSVVNAAGRRREPALLEWTLSCLSERALRAQAIDALIAYGDLAVAPLEAAFMDAEKAAHRRIYARVLKRIPTQLSVDALMRQLPTSTSFVRLQILKALNRLRMRHPELRFKSASVRLALEVELEWHLDLIRAERDQFTAGDAGALLSRAIVEKREESLDRVFRVLALTYPPQDIYRAYLGVKSSSRRVRAEAIEFLENVLKSAASRRILPLVEAHDVEEQLQLASRAFGKDLRARLDIASLLDGRDEWLRACVLFATDLGARPELMLRVKQLTEDADPVVRQTATFVVARETAASGGPSEASGPTEVEGTC